MNEYDTVNSNKTKVILIETSSFVIYVYRMVFLYLKHLPLIVLLVFIPM